MLQGFNSSFKILSSKNSQIDTLGGDEAVSKSSLPNDDVVPSSDLDDEIPF